MDPFPPIKIKQKHSNEPSDPLKTFWKKRQRHHVVRQMYQERARNPKFSSSSSSSSNSNSQSSIFTYFSSPPKLAVKRIQQYAYCENEEEEKNKEEVRSERVLRLKRNREKQEKVVFDKTYYKTWLREELDTILDRLEGDLLRDRCRKILGTQKTILDEKETKDVIEGVCQERGNQHHLLDRMCDDLETLFLEKKKDQDVTFFDCYLYAKKQFPKLEEREGQCFDVLVQLALSQLCEKNKVMVCRYILFIYYFFLLLCLNVYNKDGFLFCHVHKFQFHLEIPIF